jgi:endonuclease YncB( thermonuclease family)
MPRRLALLLALLAALPAAAQQPWVIEGPGQVMADGTIAIDGRRVRLFGLWLPQIERTCSTLLRPTFCAPKAVLVLYEKVQSFLTCQVVRQRPDGTLEAYCGQRARRLFDPHEDLGAAMVQDGWALARPDAPPEYHALERLAQSRELGFWGAKITRVR